MSSNQENRLKRLQWWLLAAVVLLFFVSELGESSMYIDGVWYAVISQNLAMGKGSMWFPQFSETIFAPFHEHPPGMFWAQAMFFEIFGSGWLTERIFSLTLYLATAVFIIHFWKKTFQKTSGFRQFWFIPLVLWQVNLASYFFLPANLLEAPLVIFDLLTILFLWNVAEGRKIYLNLVAAAFCLVFAFLIKGFTGLFPLAFLGIYWLIFRSHSFLKMTFQTGVLLIFFASIFSILFWIQPEALESLENYLDVQVLASIRGERRLYFYRSSRFYILGQMGLVILPMLLFLIFNIGIVKFCLKKTTRLSSILKSYEGKMAAVFLLVALSASLPIMISPRQALPYLLPSVPFFSLAFGIISADYFKQWGNEFLEKQAKFVPVAEFFMMLVVSGAVIFCISKFEKSNNRDAAVIHDAKKIGEVVGKSKIIASTHYDMYISGYLMRYNQISLDTTGVEHQFLLLPKDELILKNNYREVPLETKAFRLFKKQNNSNEFISFSKE